ncbi:hypothetical protein GCM10009193_17370 [Shewanella aestuarii]|nr:hypothetical protein GCM10009193_17370 [Shewanella aestuarii]
MRNPRLTRDSAYLEIRGAVLKWIESVSESFKRLRCRSDFLTSNFIFLVGISINEQ